MITIVGTGHVFNLKADVERIIDDFKPDVICVELDEYRYRGLLLKEKGIKVKSPDFLLYNILARFQEKAARIYNVEVGNEMLSALKIAEAKNIPVELIDENAQKIFGEMWRLMSPREKLRLLFASLTSLLLTKSSIERDVNKLQRNYQAIMEEVGRKFPTVKKILIDGRDGFMAERLWELHSKYERILAFVGEGHVSGIERELRGRNIEVKVIRLWELIKKKETNTAGFSILYNPPDGPVA